VDKSGGRLIRDCHVLREAMVSFSASRARQATLGPRARLAARGHLLHTLGRRQPVCTREQPFGGRLAITEGFLDGKNTVLKTRMKGKDKTADFIWRLGHDERTGRFPHKLAVCLAAQRWRTAVLS